MRTSTSPGPDRSGTAWWVLGCAAVAFVVAGALAAQGLSTVEWWIFERFNDVPWVLGRVLEVVDPLGSGLAAIVIPVVVFVVFRKVEVALVAGFAGPVAWMLAQVGKALELRGRPVDVVEEFLPAGTATGAGFPSGHTAVAVAFAVALWPYVRPPWRPVLVVLAGAVALARMHVGVHLPLDLVGGAAVGSAVGTIALLLVRRNAVRPPG